MKYLIVDTETTGLSKLDWVLEIAVIDSDGNVLMDTYVKPEVVTTWPDAQKIHGITPDFVYSGNFPTLRSLKADLLNIFSGQVVVIYNAEYDCQYLLSQVNVLYKSKVFCCMKAFANYYGEKTEFGNVKYQRLAKAAEYVGHVWNKKAHSALGDCFATLSVSKFLQEKKFFLFE
jgi:DNA polymerase III, epsilon subunit and related 3''-5'' exonucleases